MHNQQCDKCGCKIEREPHDLGELAVCEACFRDAYPLGRGPFTGPKCDMSETPANGFAGFDEWRTAVDTALVAKCGMIGDDLPDVDYRGLYATNETPNGAANYVIGYATSG